MRLLLRDTCWADWRPIAYAFFTALAVKVQWKQHSKYLGSPSSKPKEESSYTRNDPQETRIEGVYWRRTGIQGPTLG
jgi:hypothetical protein